MNLAVHAPPVSATLDPKDYDQTAHPSRSDACRTRPWRRRDVSFLLVGLCFLLSGFAALLYETAWLRQFAVVFGTSESALAVVLSCYMAGLAIGSGLAGRWVDRVERPVLLYGLLELGIGLSALAVPVAIRLVRFLHVWWLGGLSELPDSGGFAQFACYSVCAFAILLVPTALMGATLPVLVRQAVRREDQIGSRVGFLYGINTVGAVAGVVIAAFALLPNLGLRGTVWVGVGVNLVIFGIAALLARRAAMCRPSAPRTAPKRERAMTTLPAPGDTAASDNAAGRNETADSSARLDLLQARAEGNLNERAPWILPLVAISGMASFAYEILWTRLLSHILGGSIYAFATMLAGFLAGLALGSLLASWWARHRLRSVAGFALAQIGTALLSLGVYHLLTELPALAAWLGAGEYAGFRANVVVAVLALLPATLCIGATFPLAVRILARDERSAGAASAKVYAWNTIGAIAGAAAASMILLPWIGFAGTATLAIATNLLLAAAVCLVFWHVEWRPLILVALSAILLVAVVPDRPEGILRTSPFGAQADGGNILFCKAGRSTTVLLLERDGYFTMRNNGLPEARVAAKGAPPTNKTAHRWLSVLPVLARPQTRSMLIVGLGGGTVVTGVPLTVKTIDVVELEPEVVTANRIIAERRSHDPLSDPRVHVVVNDARSALELSVKHYDAIVSQPSHPWTAGASHLYTRQFASLVHDHLNADGVFVQWLNTSLVDAPLLKSVGATLLDVFVRVRMYRPNPETILFLASDGPLNVEERLAESDSADGSGTVFQALEAASPDHLHWIGVNSIQDVAATLAVEESDLPRLCGDAPVNTDNDNRLATRSPRTLGTLTSEDVDALLRPFDPITHTTSRLNHSNSFCLHRVYIARRLANSHLWSRALDVADSASAPAERQLARGLVHAKQGDRELAQQLFRESLTLDGSNPNARFAYVEPNLVPLARGSADPETVQIVKGLQGPVAAVLYACRLHAQNDVRQMANLDAWLSQVQPTDTFFTLATNFRAFWRSRVTAPELKTIYGEQSLRLIDRSLATDPSIFAALVRVQAAAAAEQNDTLVESIAYVAELFQTQAETTSPRMVRSTVPMLLHRLDVLPHNESPVIDRATEVRQRLNALLQSADH